ncbi:MAG TPA: GNAT family protein [Bryobacteraceae bacterium]|nr:GNAT family protein [Bryobacteraceae bacterium]
MRAICVDDEVELLPVETAFADELFAVTQRNLVRLGEWLPWATPDYSMAHMRVFLEETEIENAEGLALTTAIRFRGGFCGTIGLHHFDRANRSTSIGYWLDASHEGMGIVTRACAAMVTEGFRARNLHRIEIRCATRNLRSNAIPRRLGFLEEGILRDAQLLRDGWVDLRVYAMLESNWKP